MQVATFVADVTPPPGSPLCLGLVPPAVAVTDALTCRGVILLGSGPPLVLCALDWAGVAGEGHDAWRAAVAEAAGTTPDRVAVHALHQHDAPGSDPGAEAIMAAHGLPGRGHDTEFVDAALLRVRAAVRAALGSPAEVTHIGTGAARVHRVASTRRVLGADGMVAHVRYSSTAEPHVRAAPEGLIDPDAQVISLWHGEVLLAALTYYATHPQSHYSERLVTHDFVGMARDRVQAAHPRAVFVHFCGAAGNITAGKYNDGSPANRPVLAGRLADGLAAALEASAANRLPAADADLDWQTRSIALPLAPHLADGGAQAAFEQRPDFTAARDLAWSRRCAAGSTIDVGCLRLGPARVLHLPGELFVEYQLFAKALRPDLFVALAAYGDYGPGYIGTTHSYSQGGYETGPPSRVAPAAEAIVIRAIGDLLDADPTQGEQPSAMAARAPRPGSGGPCC
ncbi:hypothetical protein [Catenulispora pinisilvae]|uniref:hypothetical protein n=1 Tax=Catenulispora pinisilvae TaxID=2705253 RepID=UPI0018911AC7|nr:hypothetical protein [Catenulispora pinisilvae]